MTKEQINILDNYDNLYIIRIYGKDKTLIKFGYSSNIKQRLNNYYYHNPLMELLGTYYRANAQDLELIFHKNTKSEVMNEWYIDDGHIFKSIIGLLIETQYDEVVDAIDYNGMELERIIRAIKN